MKKFKYPLSITGDFHSLIPKLIELGYQDCERDLNGVLVTNAFGATGKLSIAPPSASHNHGRFEVPAENPELILALAACVDDGDVCNGEPYVCVLGAENFTRGKLYILQKDGLDKPFAFIDDYNDPNGYSGGNVRHFRKATKEEIINHFQMKKEETNCCQAERLFSVGESFIREAHKAACSEWKKKIENEFPGLFERFRLGQRILIDGFSDEYIICNAGDNKILLINTKSGGRFTDFSEVKDLHSITREELTRGWRTAKDFHLVERA